MAAALKRTRTVAASAFLRTWLARLGPILGLVLVILIFTLLMESPERYLSPFNLRIVLTQTVIVSIGAIGMTVIIISGAIDLSVGSVIALTGVITALSLNVGRSPVTAVSAGILAGGIIGVVNGLVITGRTFHLLCFVLVAAIEVLLFGFKAVPLAVSLVFLLPVGYLAALTLRRFTRSSLPGLVLPRLRVVPFIATLGMMGMARGLAKWFAGEQTVNVPETWVNQLLVTFPSPAWLLVAPGVWLAIMLAIVAAIVLRNTVFGRRVFALGSNEQAARACGISTDRLKIWIFGIAGLLFGLAGVMQMSRLRQGDPTVAAGTELDIIAAVVIGGGSLSGGEGSIFGSMVGALIMAFLRNGCQQLGWHNYVQEIIIGAIIVVAVAADRWRTSGVTA
jgi:ribose transport system permease protein